MTGRYKVTGIDPGETGGRLGNCLTMRRSRDVVNTPGMYEKIRGSAMGWMNSTGSLDNLVFFDELFGSDVVLNHVVPAPGQRGDAMESAVLVARSPFQTPGSASDCQARRRTLPLARQYSVTGCGTDFLQWKWAEMDRAAGEVAARGCSRADLSIAASVSVAVRGSGTRGTRGDSPAGAPAQSMSLLRAPRADSQFPLSPRQLVGASSAATVGPGGSLAGRWVWRLPRRIPVPHGGARPRGSRRWRRRHEDTRRGPTPRTAASCLVAFSTILCSLTSCLGPTSY